MRCSVSSGRTHVLLFSFSFFFSGLVVSARYSSRYSGYVCDHPIMTASWCSRGPLHLLLHQFEIMSETCAVTYTLMTGLSFSSLFCKCPRLRTFASLLTLCTFSDMTRCSARPLLVLPNGSTAGSPFGPHMATNSRKPM